MSDLQLTSRTGSFELVVDMDAREVRIDGVVQSGDFDDHLAFVSDQIADGHLVAVEEALGGEL